MEAKVVNFTLTLEQAIDLYNNGGIAKTIALKAYSEEELSICIPKDGDFVTYINKKGNKIIFIYKKNERDGELIELMRQYYLKRDNSKLEGYYVLYDEHIRKEIGTSGLSYDDYVNYSDLKYATKEERDNFIKALHDNYKDWDFENKCIIHYENEEPLETKKTNGEKTSRWRAEIGEKYFTTSKSWGDYEARCCIEMNSEFDDKRYNSNNYFKTYDEAKLIAFNRNIILKKLNGNSYYVPGGNSRVSSGGQRFKLF